MSTSGGTGGISADLSAFIVTCASPTASTGTGVWSLQASATETLNTCQQSVGASVNDTATWPGVFLAAGTYACTYMGGFGPSQGVLQFSLVGPGGTIPASATIDTFAGALSILSFGVGNVIIPTAGVYNLLLAVPSKNAGSTGFNARVSAVQLTRTA